MRRSSQTYYIQSPAGGAGSLLARVVAFVVGATVLAVAIFVGAVVLVAFIGLVLIGGVMFMARLWWIRRKLEQHAREHGDLEAEYVVIEDERRRR